MYEEASQIAADAVGSIRTVASFGAEGKVMELYQDKCKFPMQKGIRQGFVSGAAFGFSNFVMYTSYALCFWYGAQLVREGKADFEQVFKVRGLNYVRIDRVNRSTDPS
jgi:ATP-binding cassette subfamily B (MDR/TAP) protein 1